MSSRAAASAISARSSEVETPPTSTCGFPARSCPAEDELPSTQSVVAVLAALPPRLSSPRTGACDSRALPVNEAPRPEAEVSGRPPEGAGHVRLPPPGGEEGRRASQRQSAQPSG